ncbi:transposase (plasmid) [Rhodococcus sp. DMU1]|nr:transposase [Rhodococcus sp. DMU1]
MDGIRWRARTGTSWWDVPSRYGPWQTVYGMFRRWQRVGLWAQILTALQALADAAGAIVSDVGVDSAIAGTSTCGQGPRGRRSAASRAANRCRSSSPPVSVGTVHGSPRLGLL